MSSFEEITDIAVGAKRVLLLLDYDGTLVPFAPEPDLAAPDPELIALLQALSEIPNLHLHIVSGRSRPSLDAWLGFLPIGLHAEHGLWRRRASEEWTPRFSKLDVSWMFRVETLMQEAVVALPGSLIEPKTASVAWHYRNAKDPTRAAGVLTALREQLDAIIAPFELEILDGDHVIEARFAKVTKGFVAEEILRETQKAHPVDNADDGLIVIAIGDDVTDEDMFRVLPCANAITIHVGWGPTGASRRIANPSRTRALLSDLVVSLGASRPLLLRSAR